VNKYILIVSATVLLVALLFLFQRDPSLPSNPDTMTAGRQLLSGEISVGAVTLTKAEAEQQYQKIPDYVKEQLSEEQFAEQLINKELLLSQAEKEGISISEQETDQALQQFLDAYNLTEAQFEQTLDGMTLDDVKADYMQRLTVSKLVEQHVNLGVEVSDAEVDAAMKSLGDDIGQDVEVFRDKIKMQLQAQKQAELAKAYINQLRGDAHLAKME